MSGTESNSFDLSAEKLRRWRLDVPFFAIDELGFQPDPWQFDLFRVFPSMKPEHQHMAMQACKGPGKTAALAVLILNFMTCYGERNNHPRGAATSITEDNIDDNLWPEIAKWQGNSEFLKRAFTWTKSRFFASDHPKTFFFSKRTWPKGGDATQQANTLAGLHSKFLLYVLDESGGIPDAVMVAADAGLTGTEQGRFQKILQAGNPTHLSGPLYRAATSERDTWYLIVITGDPDDPKRSSRQSIEWARDQIKKWGRDSPWVIVNVLGQFPPSSLNALLGANEVSAAMGRNLSPEAYMDAQKRIGVDVARFGDDSTILFPRQGLRAFIAVEMKNKRSTVVADRVIYSKNKWGSELEFVDGTGGYGAGVIDSMVQRGYNPIEVQFAGKANDPRFANKRMEIWWNMAEHVKRGLWLPNDTILAKELVAPTYSFTQNGKMILEPKEMVKARLGFSPDRADGLALTYAQPDTAGRKTLLGQYLEQKQNKVDHEYDPYSDERMNS